MKEKVLYYAECKNGTVDVVENVNGKDLGNYNYDSLESVKRDYPENEWVYVNLGECEVED